MKKAVIYTFIGLLLFFGVAAGSFFQREYRLEKTMYSHATIEPTLYVGPNSGNDGDIASINASGDTAYFWVEGATRYRNGLLGTFIGHNKNGFLALGRWDGQWNRSSVVVRTKQFEIRPRMDLDSVFVVTTDSTNESCDVNIYGEVWVGPDEDGDGEIWYKNSYNDSSVVDMDGNSTSRAFFIQHSNTGRAMGVLSGRNGSNGRWDVIGDFSVTNKFLGDSLFFIGVDSSATPTAYGYLSGNLHVAGSITADGGITLTSDTLSGKVGFIGPEPGTGDGEWFFVNASNDTAYIDMDNNARVFYIAHAPSGEGFGALIGKNGRHGLWKVVGDLGVYRSVLGDSLFFVDADSSTGFANMYMRGEAKIGPDADGDGEIWLFNQQGDSSVVDMDGNSTSRAFFIQHSTTGRAAGILSGRNGWNGDWRVVGDFSVRSTAFGDSLFNVDIDSIAGNIFIYCKDEIKSGWFLANPGLSNPSYEEGRIFYDSTYKALSYYNDDPDVVMTIGRENWVRAWNNSGGVIYNGEAVYVSGALYSNPTIAKAKADAAATSASIGLATHEIPNNSWGYITCLGAVNGVDTDGTGTPGTTETWAVGDLLYVSATTAGRLTNVKPANGFFAQLIAIVSYVDGTDGKIHVNVGAVENVTTAYGEMYTDSDIVVSLASIGTYYTIPGWTDGISRLATLTDSTITVTNAGIYALSAYISFTHATNNALIHISLFEDDVENTKFEIERKIGTGGDVGCVAGTAIVELTAGQVLKLKGKTTLAGNLTVTHANFNLHRVQ